MQFAASKDCTKRIKIEATGVEQKIFERWCTRYWPKEESIYEKFQRHAIIMLTETFDTNSAII
jgi:hypothetical protein